MDIGVIKSKYGERLILIGDEIVNETKDYLRRAAPG
jgi:hypothetical protein